MADFAPGPWRAYGFTVTTDKPYIVAYCDSSKWDQSDYGDESKIQRDMANARLIAAAPELLAALEEMIENIEDMDVGFIDRQGGFWQRALAAIALANGK